MVLLTLGVLIWTFAHLWKRLHHPSRIAFSEGQARGIVTVLLLLSVLLMVVGYRHATGPVWWGPEPMLRGINNLLMLVSVYLFAAAGAKPWVGVRFRHPMLTGFILWCVAHLLVNGDAPSLVLWGGLMLWALAEIALINRTPWTPGPVGPRRKEYTTLAAALVVFGVIAWVHALLGYPVFA